jgi:hypothetical protein
MEDATTKARLKITPTAVSVHQWKLVLVQHRTRRISGGCGASAGAPSLLTAPSSDPLSFSL